MDTDDWPEVNEMLRDILLIQAVLLTSMVEALIERLHEA